MPDNPPLYSGAAFSADGRYRYTLERRWDPLERNVLFVMLNPSTATAEEDDPTIRRCIGYARAWRCGLLVGNLFALRSTDPRELYRIYDPVGPENDAYLKEMAQRSERVIVAWGAHGTHHARSLLVAELLGPDLYALGTTKDGQPRHPLYLPKDAEPVPWRHP